jgi:hypothetical protein
MKKPPRVIKVTMGEHDMREIEECLIHLHGIFKKDIRIPTIKQHLTSLNFDECGKSRFSEIIAVNERGIISEHPDSHGSHPSLEENIITQVRIP